jgi:hypothetical protein
MQGGTGKRLAGFAAKSCSDEELPNAGVGEAGPVDRLSGKGQSYKIAIRREALAVDDFSARGCAVFQRSDLRLFARLPGILRNNLSSVQADVFGVGFFFSGGVRLFDACQTDDYGDGEALLMSPFQIVIGSHAVYSGRAPLPRGGLVAPRASVVAKV